MSYERIGTNSLGEIKAFEAEIGFELPSDYCDFLMDNGGAIFSGSYPMLNVAKLPTLCVGSLFGLGAPDVLNLRFWFKRYQQELPPKSLIIGGDPGGAFYLLICDGGDKGVYFYDHAHELPSSDSHQNSYAVAEDFSSFANSIGVGS